MTGDLEFVQFMTVESEDDYIVSFYVTEPDDPMSGRSIILMRAKKSEHLIEEQDKGVRVSDESFPEGGDGDDNYLAAIRIGNAFVEIESSRRRYKLDLRRIEKSEIRAARKALKKMNFDKRFKLKIVQ